MATYILDAGYPWGLRIGPATYLLREHMTKLKPQTYASFREAMQAAIAEYRTAPCYPRVLAVREWKDAS